MRPDVAAVTEVFDAIGGKSAVNLLLTGHSHFDHSFDTATWARLSGARIIGSPTTCLQVRAAKIPARRCTPVFGGEKFTLEAGVDMYVIRWNHSGDPAKNPEQHDPVELRDAAVAGRHRRLPGGRRRRFPERRRQSRLSVQGRRTAGTIQLVVPGLGQRRRSARPDRHRRPQLRRAARQSARGHAGRRLESVDLWIATGGRDVAALVLPVLKPKAYLPVHWDGLFGAFKAGPPQPYADAALETLLEESGVRPIIPVQYMDRWRLDAKGVQTLENREIKQKLGFH